MIPQEVAGPDTLFFVSHSGGKDSQAMYLYLTRELLIPEDQIVVIHAHLDGVEWPGVIEHIEDTITAGTLNTVRSQWKDGSPKTLLNMIERRFETRPDVPSFPSAAYRQCTSDLKRGPIQKFVRHTMKARGATVAVNCMGLRAQESAARAKKDTWKLNSALSKAGRTVYDWLPIHGWTTLQVFSYIESHGQEAFHAYKGGNERLSCMFCIMGCTSDLRHAARVNPDLAGKLVDLEHRTGYGMFGKDNTLEARLAGIPITVEHTK